MAKTRTISFSYTDYTDEVELQASERELAHAAKNAARLAYAPYSGFRVGAAIRLESGIIVCGSNVENAAFPSGTCAEKAALVTAITNHPDDKPIAIAIAATNEDSDLVKDISPCGNCRQVISEEENRRNSPIKLILYMKNIIRVIDSAGLLLPLQFNKNSFRQDLPSQ